MSISGKQGKGFEEQFGKSAAMTDVCPVTWQPKCPASMMEKSLEFKEEGTRALRLGGLLFHGQIEPIVVMGILGP